jgi:hypothetical protein
MFLVPLEGHLRVDLRPLQRPVAERFGDDPDVHTELKALSGRQGRPPAISSVSPLTHAASEEARKTAAAGATS